MSIHLTEEDALRAISDATKMKGKKCQVPECDRISTTAGYCPGHYNQVRRYGRIVYPKLRAYVQGFRPCQHEGCDHRAVARDRCNKHIQQFYRSMKE